jgi:hypothetical protein
MSTATIAPVNPMSAEGKDTVMNVMRRDRANFTRLVEDPKNWNVMTRCTGWETRDLVGHMIDVMEGYFKNWEAAKAGKPSNFASYRAKRHSTASRRMLKSWTACSAR